MRRTTICCSGLVFLVASLAAWRLEPASRSPVRPPSLFPLEVAWTTALASGVTASPVYDSTRVYVSLRGGHVVAVTLSDGRIEWSIPFATPIGLAAGDSMVFAAGKDTLLALDAEDGRVRWQLLLASPASAPPIWDAGWLIVGLQAGDVIALRAADGVPIWRRNLGSHVAVPPSLVGRRLYVGLDDGRALSLDMTSGAPLWERRLGGQLTGVLALSDRLYVGSTRNFLYCLSAADGTTKWTWRTGADVIGTPAIDDDHVFFTALDNVLRALDHDSGVQRWSRPLPVRPTTGPQKVGAVLLASGLSPALPVYYAGTGEPAGTLTAPSELTVPPRLVDRPLPGDTLVLLATVDPGGEGRLQALRRATGPPLAPLQYIPGAPDSDLPTAPLKGGLPGTELAPEEPVSSVLSPSGSKPSRVKP